MSKKIVRITESDLVKIVKRVLNEQGGYDDPTQMAIHSGSVLGGLGRIVDSIIDMLHQSLQAIGRDIPKTEMMGAMTKMTDVLDLIEDNLRKINPEIMLNRDLKRSVSDLRRKVKRAKERLRVISSVNRRFYDPEMPKGLTGAGFSMDDRELNDRLSEILLSVSTSAEKLAFQLMDEEKNMIKRFDRLN